MQTEIVILDPNDARKNSKAIKKAAAVIKSGGLVSFPTETVYGLGADALNPEAVKKIFAAKGRPPDNPLIVHVASMSALDHLAADIPPAAYRLARLFWPGPFTMILKKRPVVPPETTGGLDTVAVRFPSDSNARLLIEESGTPIAAPSANGSGTPSATESAHVESDFYGRIDMILDGGPSAIGIESTVADLSSFPPRLLRPGFVTFEELIRAEPSFIAGGGDDTRPRSPGMKYTHYSPAARVVVVTGDTDEIIKKISELESEYAACGKKTGIMASDETARKYLSKNTRVISAGSRARVETVARNLFKILREFDYYGTDVILAEGYPENGLGLSVMDRLVRAAGGGVLRV